jgi:23S rRNA-/tRNA-specific pseudouridylate synthase
MNFRAFYVIVSSFFLLSASYHRNYNLPTFSRRIVQCPLQAFRRSFDNKQTTKFRVPVTTRKDSSSSSTSIRINKCLTKLSRRAADEAILNQRVLVNGKVAKQGDKVQYGDTLVLDSHIVTGWQELIAVNQVLPSVRFDSQDFVYLKYWKPVGVVCTANRNESDNIMRHGKFSLYPQRLFTVGRLDKDSSGLILVTSDGRVNDALLNQKTNVEKVRKF